MESANSTTDGAGGQSAKERAAEGLSHLEKFGLVHMDVAAEAACLAAHLGDVEKAFRFLAKAVEMGNDTLAWFEGPGHFEPLHPDPRWSPFIEAMRGRADRYRRELAWPLPT